MGALAARRARRRVRRHRHQPALRVPGVVRARTTSPVTEANALGRGVARVLGADHHHLDQVPGARDAGRQPRRGRHPGADRAGDPASAGTPTGAAGVVVTLGVFGTALLYGDGLITPAISVLSAVEGFEVATPAFEQLRRPDRRASSWSGCSSSSGAAPARIGKVFGPVMIVWFAVHRRARRPPDRPASRACCRRSTRSTSSSFRAPSR